MASRRLALNLQQSLRNRQALRSINPWARGLATPVTYGSKTESTTLSNGFTVRRLLQFDVCH
jgi:processing peptidase subunit beta